MSKKCIIIWLIIGIIFSIGISTMLYVFIPRKLKINVKLPKEFEISNFDNYVLIESDELTIHYSEDRSPYEDTFWYIDYYQNRFYTNKDYLKENNITLHENRIASINR
jgi:hypothetical protein